MHPRFPHIFTPIRIRNMEMRNRIAISGHHAGWWIDDGMPSDEFVAYIEERAKGGVGLFVIGCTSPKPGSGWLENLDDGIVPRYAKCVEAANRHGARLIAQLAHPGFYPLPGIPLTLPVPTAAPTQPHPRRRERRHVMSRDEIQEMVAVFGDAAGRCAAGGVDGVELHSHEWFLHAQMLNPMWNERTDEYGGSLENRMRFMVETLQAMRKAVGPDLVVGVRLKADDMEQRGNDANEMAKVVESLEAQGLIDYVLYTGGDARLHHGPMARPEEEWVGLVSGLRAQTSLPVMHAGRIMTAEGAERALSEGAMDVVVMTKAHIAEPHFVKKVYENRMEDIRYCTRCLQSCHAKMDLMTCVYNPLTSRELEWAETPALTRKKRVVVVGGGPAGCEAALTAAQRGHDVIVLERDAAVGGQVLIGAGSPTRKPWAKIAEFYARHAAKGVFDVRYSLDATVEVVLDEQPDAVIVATGSTSDRLVLNHVRTSTVHEALSGALDNARRVVIVDREGFMRPWVVADRLSSAGAEVIFVTPLLRLSPSVEGWVLDELLRRVGGYTVPGLDRSAPIARTARPIRFLPGHDIGSWTPSGDAILRDVQRGDELIISSIDAVVGCIGSSPVNALSLALRDQVPELHVIGDAVFPTTVESATYQGARLGRMI